MKTVYILGKCFSSPSDNGENSAQVLLDGEKSTYGSVLVYDPIARMYTSCHSLTLAQEQTIREARSGSTVEI